MEKEDGFTATFCPSFSSYTGDGLVETAERVRLEISDEYSNGDEFEFVSLRSDLEAFSFSHGCGFVFPIFNRNLVPEISAAAKSGGDKTKSPTRLRDLLLRDREDGCSSSSSSSDEEEEHEVDVISSEIYCPWTPEKSRNGGFWRKSKSTGSSSSSSSSSSRRWRVKDLLKRSYSEGKQSPKFLNSNSTNRDESSKKETKKEKVSSAHEKFYLKTKAKKEEEKRKSYLPYKQDLVGLLFNRHRHYGKTLSSFFHSA